MSTKSEEINLKTVTTQGTDTIETPKIEEQRVKLGGDIIAKKGEKRETKRCFKEHKKQSEARNLAGALMASNGVCVATNIAAFASSIIGINHEKDNIAYYESAYYSLLSLAINSAYVILAAVKLKKLKHIDQGKQIKLALKEKKQEEQNMQNAIAEFGSHDKSKTK